jgi:NAD(P)H dehydrogenase (quinone)
VRILIIGALGNLASATLERLTSDYPATTVRLTSHRDAGVQVLRARYPNAETMKADWNDAASLRAAVAGVDRVLVVMTDFVINESIATPNLIRALREEGRAELVLRFIALPPGLERDKLSAEVLATRAGAMLTLEAKPRLDASGLPVCYVNAACWIAYNVGWFYAHDIRESRQIRMPASTDMARQWVTEGDLAAVFARILTDPAASHVGREYHMAGGPRLTYAAQATLIGRVLGETVRWVDDDLGLRRAMGEGFDTLMTYLEHETEAYRDVPTTRDLENLLGRERTSLEDYVRGIRAELV